jgi:hypothetical protein
MKKAKEKSLLPFRAIRRPISRCTLCILPQKSPSSVSFRRARTPALVSSRSASEPIQRAVLLSEPSSVRDRDGALVQGAVALANLA